MLGTLYFKLQNAHFSSGNSPWIQARTMLAIGGSIVTIALLYLGSLTGRLDFSLYMGGTAAVLLLLDLYDHWLLNHLLSGGSMEVEQ
jgi:hypothetical protein